MKKGNGSEDNFDNEDLFGIDLNDLASGVFSEESTDSGTKEGKENIQDSPEDLESIDEEFLANMVTEDEDQEDLEQLEEREKKDTKEKTPDSKGSPSSPLLTSLAQTLLDEGVLAGLEPDKVAVKDAKELVDLIRQQIKDNEFADLNDYQKQYLEAIRAGVPAEFAAQTTNNLMTYSSIEETDIEAEDEEGASLRKQVLINEFLAKGFAQDKAQKLAQRSIDLGEDVEDAKQALQSLKELELKRLKNATSEATQTKEQLAKKAQEEKEALKTKVLETDEFVKGVKVNSTTKEKVYETLTKVVDYDKAGRPLNAMMKDRSENSSDFDIRMAYWYHITNGFKSVNKVAAVKNTKAIDELEKKLKSEVRDTTASGLNMTTKKASLLKALEEIDPKKL